MKLNLLMIEPIKVSEKDCVQELKEVINVKLAKGETTNDLFRKLRELYPNDEIKKEIVENWISEVTKTN